MLGHDLGDDLVLALEYGFEFGQALLLALGRAGVGTGTRRRPVLEERLLPLVKLRRRDLVLLADLQDGNFVQQMLPEDIDLLFGTELSALTLVLFVVAHALFQVRKSILAQPRQKDIPTEAGYLWGLVVRLKKKKKKLEGGLNNPPPPRVRIPSNTFPTTGWRSSRPFVWSRPN
ncbi:MAG TPA: hypothetical protein P5233_13220 [Candidatus Paceibacterota bacterium]|nr:hypothetical protein [Candidatus Paceibacterota bacterium]